MNSGPKKPSDTLGTLSTEKTLTPLFKRVYTKRDLLKIRDEMRNISIPESMNLIPEIVKTGDNKSSNKCK